MDAFSQALIGVVVMVAIGYFVYRKVKASKNGVGGSGSGSGKSDVNKK